MYKKKRGSKRIEVIGDHLAKSRFLCCDRDFFRWSFRALREPYRVHSQKPVVLSNLIEVHGIVNGWMMRGMAQGLQESTPIAAVPMCLPSYKRKEEVKGSRW